MKLSLLALLLSATVLSAQTLAPLPPDGFVTLAQIVADFSAAPDAATQKYSGQRVLVYGTVGQISQGDDNSSSPLSVFLQLPNNTTPDVKCIFTLSDIPEGGQDAAVQISGDGRQATLFHRNREGDLNGQKPFITVGQNLGIRGTFDQLVAGDIVLKDAKKEDKGKLMEILKQHGISTE